MSTALSIIEYEKAGRLIRFLPLFRGNEVETRFLTIVPDLHRWVYDEGDTEEVAELKAAIRAHFGEFVRGELVIIPDFMKPVGDQRGGADPFGHGVWAIGTRFQPQYRFFGFFVLTDWFLALTKQDRDSLALSPNAWHAQIDGCRKIWRELLPGVLPIISNNEYAYLSENVENWDERWHRN